MSPSDVPLLKPNVIVRGPLFPEPVQVIVTIPLGKSIKLVGRGLRTSQVHELILSPEQLATVEATPAKEPFDGDAGRFRLGIEAMRLALAYEYDPFFTLSIARVDPLPHQLEAIYDYFLKLPRIRFLLADQWQREMKDRFREPFEILRGETLRANYGSNPWQEKNQLITSISWVSRIEDARKSLLRSHWDLIIVDEAHKMSAYSADKKTLAYQLGEALSEMTDHYLLMTATPHKGDLQNFCLFPESSSGQALELLDKDVYGDVKSLEEAMRRNYAPFYLRRVKEAPGSSPGQALVTFPDPDTGQVKTIFTRRNVQTVEFQLNGDEWDFYDALTRYVEDQSINAAADDTARDRALGFTMALLQRRFASSIYAVRRSLQRMKEKRERILADPEAYRREQILKQVPEDFDDLPEEEQQEIVAQLEGVVASIDPAALKEEILQLAGLIDRACLLEQREVESKLVRLKELLTEHGVFHDPKMKLLVFTEHKETLDYLVGHGREGQPLGKLREWGLSVTQIHGGMKIGDRETPGTRIYANQLERMVREMYARNLTEEIIKNRIVQEVDTERFRRITHSTLEGLARRELNLFSLIGRSAEARERRLVPEVMEDFFVQAAPLAGVHPKETRRGQHTYRIGRIPRTLWPIGERLEPRFGRLGREYKQIVFDKQLLTDDPTLEWVTPGHPLFESVREDAWERIQNDLRRGAVFFDLHRKEPARLDAQQTGQPIRGLSQMWK